MRGRAGLENPTAASGGNHRHVGAESMNRSVLKTPREQAFACAVLIHQEVEREVLDEESRSAAIVMHFFTAGLRSA
jgi:hypothetical protein